MRTLHRFASIVVLSAALQVASGLRADDGLDETEAIHKIGLLGGRVERDDSLPGDPVVRISFENSPRFTDKYLHLITGFPFLITLQLCGTTITDEGLQEIGTLTDLTSLELSGPEITDAGLEQLDRMTSLLNLVLSDTRVTPAGLKRLKTKLPNVRIFDSKTSLSSIERQGGRIIRSTNQGVLAIAAIRFKGPGIGALSADAQRMAALECNIVDHDLEELRSLKGIQSLRSLSLTGCYRITDIGVREVAELENLTSLDVSDCPLISDFSLQLLGKLENLTNLDLSRTLITGSGLNALQQLKRLTSLAVDDCEITDDDMPQLARLTSLTRLRLCRTQITDQSMGHLSRLTNLQSISLSGNQLTDAALKDLRKLKSLKQLDLFGCSEITNEGLNDLKADLPDLVVRH